MSQGEAQSKPTSRQWFLTWLKIGLQSFGGGVTTLALIRQEVVERTEWFSPEEYLRDYALCQLTPGVNILAFAVLLGRRIGGTRGVIAALAGLLLPSAIATAALTAVYASAKQSSVVQSALRFVLPAVAGLGISTAIQTAQGPMVVSWAERGASPLVSFAIIGLPALAVSVYHCPTFLALAAGAVMGGAWVYLRHRMVSRD